MPRSESPEPRVTDSVGADDFAPRSQAPESAVAHEFTLREPEPAREPAVELQATPAPAEAPPPRIEVPAEIPAFNLTPSPTPVPEPTPRPASDAS